MPDLSTSIREYYDAAAEPVDVPEILERSGHRRVVPNWAVAVAAALAVFVLIGGFVWLISGTDSEVIEEPMPTVTTSVPTTVPDETPVSLPDETPPVSFPDETTPPTGPDAAPLVTIDPDQINYPRPGDETYGIAVADGFLWAATGEGIVRWDVAEQRAEVFTTSEDLPFSGRGAHQVLVAPDGTVWAVSGHEGIARFDGSGWSEALGYDQLAAAGPPCVDDDGEDDGGVCVHPITGMAIGPDNLVSLAVGPETLLQFDGADWSVLPVTDAEIHGGSAWGTSMAVAPDGTLWVASWEELLAYDGDTWGRFTANDGLPSGMIGSVAVAPNGDVWVGTIDDSEGNPSGGVARFNGDTWTVFDEADGLHDKSVAALTVGPDGTVWAVHSDTSDLGSVGEPTTGGISRFDGATWSATSVANVGILFGWGGADVDDAGTLWITSSWGVIGFDGSEATVLRLPPGTRPPINALPSTSASQILPASEDPFEWRWEVRSSFGSDVTGMKELVKGDDCYGGGSPQGPSAVVAFDGGSIDFSLGYRSTPDIVVTDAAGTVTQVGNPFGELAWLCSVAATDTHILAVGSGVSWSEDGIAWHGIDAFEQVAGWNIDGLMWAAAGSGGYLVFGHEGAVWFSEDLQTWYETPLEGNESTGTSVWGWVGPYNVSVEEEIVINMGGDGWIGTRREG